MRVTRGDLLSRFVAAFALAIIAVVGVVVGGLIAGYRPVVIQTGSMGTTAPPRSLIIAAPQPGSSFEVGDIVVMRRPGKAPVTHRIIEIEQSDNTPFAITKGDANESPDAAPYSLDGEQLVSRWIVPGLGGWMQTIFQPGLALGLVALATLVITIQTLRGIWSDDPQSDESDAALEVHPLEPRGRRRRVMTAAAVPLTLAMTVGVAWALFQSNDVVAANDFGTRDCYDPQLAGVQSGEAVHAVNGTVTVPITPVDPTKAFVLASVRSNSNEPSDATVAVQLTGGGTAVELVRPTDAGAPPLVTVAWSVVEYGCGVTVQRGSIAGDGDNSVTAPLAVVDPNAAFAVVTSAGAADRVDFGRDDLFAPSLTATDLTISSDPLTTFDPQRLFEWQVVSFDDPADVLVQNISTTLGLTETTASVTIPSPVDTSTTFLLGAATTASAGPDIGERLVRAHLVDPTSVEVSRSIGGDPIEVHVQVVTLRDGSTVRHGTVDFNAGEPAKTIQIEPVDPTRSTALSTVGVPGLMAGGMSDHIADDVVGEASATFALTDSTTVIGTRVATNSNASFGWQVIEWAGPGWWDPDYVFRQRIDVDAAAVAAPDAYTVPLSLDHAALVDLGLAGTDGDDLRVLRWDGTAWTELDRVLDESSGWNAVDTTIWFRTVEPIAADRTSTYWLYYGNDAPAAPLADPEAVYLLVEDFEAGGLGDFEDRTGGTGWYEADPWTRRVALTVPAAKVTEPLSDFPLLVSMSLAELSTLAQPDGSDIRFTAADGLTPLAHEIESWNAATGSLVAWVRVPVVTSAAPTTLYLYFGAPNAPAQSEVRGTWPNPVVATWHLARDPSGSAPQLDDATANNHDGLSSGSMTGADLVPALVGDGLDLDGIDDVLTPSPIVTAATPALTISAWVRPAGADDATLIAKANGLFDRVFEMRTAADGSLVGQLSLDGALVTAATGPAALTPGTWHHVAMVWDGSALSLVLDGTEQASTPASGTLDVGPSMAVTVGRLTDGTRPFLGVLDEVRVEAVARSVVWLAANEQNQRLPAGFVSTGAVESGNWMEQSPWASRKPIVVSADLTENDITNYPLLVQTIDADLAAGAALDGADVVFTAADGTTRLDHVVESWNPATGALTAWVGLPLLSATTDTSLFIYFGNPTAVDQQDPVAVFGPDADLVLLGGS